MASLPTCSEIHQAVRNGDVDVGKCLLQLLTYATDTSDGTDLGLKIKSVSHVLVQAWEGCIELEDNLVDALWLKSCMLSTGPDGDVAEELQDKRRRAQDALIQIIMAVVNVPGRTSFCIKLQANLLPHFLDAAGLVSEEELLKRLRIHNTQINYKQQKYNLLQEESEGYAKLIVFLSAGSGTFMEQLTTMRQLIGTFELDPSRVMDLAIDVLEAKLYPEGVEKDFAVALPDLNDAINRLLDLIRHLSVEQLPSVLSFKLAAPGTATQSLFRVIALLVREGIFDFSMMFKEYSTPLRDEIHDAFKVQWMMEKKRIQSLTRVSLSGSTKEDPKMTELKERFQKELLRLSSNPTIHVLCLLIRWGQWEDVKPLLPSNSWEKLCCLFPEKFGSAFCDSAQRRLDPWYRSRVGTPGLSGPDEMEITQPLVVDGRTIDDVVQDVAEFLLYTLHSGCIQYRPVLYCQLCRVMRTLLEDDSLEHVPSDETFRFFKLFMVPSLSLFGANPSISSELWSVLERFSYPTRYRLYEDWKGKGVESMGLGASPLCGKPLPVTESEINAGKAARYTLKRLSKDNIRDMSRLLAKATHSAPLVVYGTILNQIESYDNMVDVMVEAQRFSSPLGLDVLAFSILSRLSGKSGGVNRNLLKEDGVNVSQWLQSIEAFSGAFFKRFPFIEFRGILSYIMKRLRDGKVMELGILASLLKVAGGYGFADYSPVASLSVTQLEGRAGSFALKRETMSFGIFEGINRRATDTIKVVLQSDGLGVSLLMLIAQARSRIIFESTKGPSKPVKLIGNLVDTCQIVMSILLDFLTTDEGDGVNAAIEKYAEHLPPLDDLCFNYGLDVQSCWMLTRPLGLYEAKRENNDESEGTSLLATQDVSFQKKYESILPAEAWTYLSHGLFEAFYRYALYDIFWPEDVYNSEYGRISKEVERLERQKTGAPTGGTVQTIGKDENDLERLKKVLVALSADKEKQKEHVQVVRQTLDESKNDLILSEVASQDASKALLIHCVYPRSLQSPDDAMYCAQFALQLHNIQTPGFSILHYIDELVYITAGSLYGVTEAEAANLAIILWRTWSVISRWRYEEGCFEEEVAGKPGSFMEKLADDGSSEVQEVSNKDFMILYNNWHATLGAALIGCLESKEYMHTRSGLVVLTRLVDVFPTRPKLGNIFLKTLEPLQDESSDRPDIRAAANAYSTMLTRARDDGKWKEEDASVAKARADKEKMAAEKRKKKLEEQFRELQKDSENLKDLDHDRRRDRSYGGRGGPEGRGGPAPEVRDTRDRRSPPRELVRRERDSDRGADRGPLSRVDDSRRGGDEGRGGPALEVRDTRDRRSPPREPIRRDRDSDRSADRGPSTRAGDNRRSTDRGGRRDGLEEGRWLRGETQPTADDRGGRGSRAPPPDLQGGRGANTQNDDRAGRGLWVPPPDHQGGRGANAPADDRGGGRGLWVPPPDHQGERGANAPTDDRGGRGTRAPPTDLQGGRGATTPLDDRGGRGSRAPQSDHQGGRGANAPPDDRGGRAIRAPPPDHPGGRGTNAQPDDRAGRGLWVPPPDLQGGRGAGAPLDDRGGRGARAPPTDHQGGRGSQAPISDDRGGRGSRVPPPDHQGGRGANAPPDDRGGRGPRAPPPDLQGGRGANAPPDDRGGRGSRAPPPDDRAGRGSRAPPPDDHGGRGTKAPSDDRGGRGSRAPPPDHQGGRGSQAPISDDRGVRGSRAPPPDHSGGRGTNAPSDDRGGRGSKRGRGSSPDTGLEERGKSKRSRVEESNHEPRRISGRGSSPPMRDRSSQEPSRSSRQGRRR